MDGEPTRYFGDSFFFVAIETKPQYYFDTFAVFVFLFLSLFGITAIATRIMIMSACCM